MRKKRNFDSVARMKKLEDALEAEQLVPKVDRAELFKVPTSLTYGKLPANAGPPYPRAKPARRPLPARKHG
jgi:hypothetical protein